jgi:transcriptional regulatory protein LevR
MMHYEPRTKTPIEVHLENLVQLGILRRNSVKRKNAIEDILKGCKDEYEMSRKLHDLWTGNKTVEQFISQYGRGN